ncbi:hypothetical protein ACL03H_12650 [Saccharopolyspora sp. MS10]|uniref:hypothetical protein n=1 Tax=Saccharopolyspora sp. MS10 TaxID=3385973 RepID=UPI0039A36E51
MRLPRAWFLPPQHDVLAMLLDQADTSRDAVELLGRWVRRELAALEPDPGTTEIVQAIGAASRACRLAVSMLPHPGAAEVAEEAGRLLEPAEHGYRSAIIALDAEADLRAEIRRRELYRRAEHATTAMARVLHRIWYAVSKTG